MMHWKTSRRTLDLSRPLVMGILNATPDSFSDGGQYSHADTALHRAAEMVAEGADIIDIGGESTRPGSNHVSSSEEIDRVIPVIEQIRTEFDTAISIDTTKSDVAVAAINAGAEIVNDISGLRFDPGVADVAARSGAGIVLMHSRGEFSEMHSQPHVDDILAVVTEDFRRSIKAATDTGVQEDRIVLDVGIGFGKSFEQNLELIAKLDKLVERFPEYPMLVGTSRKSFIGRVMGGAAPEERLAGSIAAAAIAVWNGASIIRVHDVHETAEALKVVAAVKKEG
jgi:dihydropteroate synthase